MAMHVRELLELPHLALELIAGGEGVDAVVRWTHVSEVEDPTPWLEGGELILTTGVGLPTAARAQAAYLRRLARAGAAGLVIVEDSAPPLAPTLRTTAERLAFPLVKTTLKQPFRAIAEVVVAANANADSQRLVDHLRIYGVLRAAASDGAAPHNVLARLGDLTAMRLAVVRDDGHPQFGPGPPHARWEEATQALAAAGGRKARRGAYARLEARDGRPGGFVIQLDAAAPSRVFLVAEGVEPSATPDLVAAHHIATIMAATVLAQRAERAVEQKLGAQLLR
ncbi:MAG TPA: PucR family transcriptional regulator ligand-binding domain-containing protein, partial [Conexibacter sp.]|nr:PucR family transcriptional regulator ligand-binding domain-containing protein [Conexibacter sp.]